MNTQKLDIPDMELLGNEEYDGPVANIFQGNFLGALKATHPWYESNTSEMRKTILLIDKIKEELLPMVDVEDIENSMEVPLAVVVKMGELGLFKIKAPESYGGLGFKQLEYNHILMFLSSIHSSLPAYVSATNSLGLLYPLVHYGTDEQCDLFLEDVLEWPTGFCFTEKNAGSNPAAIATYATRVYEYGEAVGYKITGEKWYTTNALRARFLAVVAYTTDSEEGTLEDGEKKEFSVFLIPTGAAGVTIGPANEFAGMEGIDNANPTFEQVFVPVINRIGDEGDGFRIALEGLNSGRTAVAAIMVATHKWALAISHWWTKVRHQMGGEIGKQQLVTQKIYRMTVSLYAMEAITDCAAGRFDQKLDGRLEAALCKRVAVSRAWESIDDALQIRGGRGYEKETSLSGRESPAPQTESAWRASRVSRIFEGTEQIVALWTFSQAFMPYLSLFGPLFPGKPFWGKPLAALKVVWLYVSLLLPRLLGNSISDFPRPLRRHLKKTEKLTRRLARKIIMICGKNGAKMPHQQNHMERFFLITAELFAIIAVCSRAAYEEEDAGMELADEYCRFAFIEIDKIFRQFSENNDDRLLHLYNNLQKGDYDSLEEGIIHPLHSA